MLNRRAVSGVQRVMRMPYSLDQLHTDEFNSPTTVHPIKLVKPEEPDVVTTFFGLYTLQEQSGATAVAVVHCRLNTSPPVRMSYLQGQQNLYNSLRQFGGVVHRPRREFDESGGQCQMV